MIQAGKLAQKTALITGAARRLGAQTARTLHENGANIIIHYGESQSQAEKLAQQLNDRRPDTVVTKQADLLNPDEVTQLAEFSITYFDGLDILVNNASSFYPTVMGNTTQSHWNDLMGSNVQAPFFLSQACIPALKLQNGCIINMIDIHARSPLKNHTVYSCAKAAAAMLTRSLALETGPEVRVNGIAPGAILWPEENTQMDDQKQQDILRQIPLGRCGEASDIANTVLFLINSPYINGQIISVDGGRQLF